MANRKPVRKSDARKSASSSTNLKWIESYTSLLLGIVVVIILAVLIVSFIRGRVAQKDTSSTKTETTQVSEKEAKEGVKAENGKKVYTVVEGDTLWKISEKLFDSGYNWVDLAKANNLSNPNSIEVGDKLTVPTMKVTPSQAPTPTVTVVPTEKASPTVTPAPVGNGKGGAGIQAGTTYTVKPGDYLWDIAVRTYGDGYKWVEIARSNKLINPDVIHPGNQLTLPK